MLLKRTTRPEQKSSARAFLKNEWAAGKRYLDTRREAVRRILGGVALVGCSFGAGFIEGTSREVAPLLIEVPPIEAAAPQEKQAAVTTNPETTRQPVSSPLPVQAACAYVGSRQSDKYHLPHCTYAKRIKPENQICFSSREEAERKGYAPGCIK